MKGSQRPTYSWIRPTFWIQTCPRFYARSLISKWSRSQPLFKIQYTLTSAFTFGAWAASMEWGAWKLQAATIYKSSEIRALRVTGRNDTNLFWSSTKTPGRPCAGKWGPSKPGNRPTWVPAMEGSFTLMFKHVWCSLC